MASDHFAAGKAAFAKGAAPIDNPHFADPKRAGAFNDWSDGWISAWFGTLPAKSKATAYPRWRENHPRTFRGITSTWSARAR